MARFYARMYYLAIPWLLLAVVLGSICVTERVNASRKGKGNQTEFDYFVLALQWPGTFCRRTRHCCSSGDACCRGSKAPAEFTIRGLWPDYNDGSWPAYCSQSSFDPEKISTLVKALELYWPPLKCGSPSSCNGGKGSFWACEWEKHGACSFPVIQDEYNYFLRALVFYFQYNVTGVLNDAGYIPSNTIKYPLHGIISAIENAFHASPLIVCKNGYVEELRVCISKESKPQNCTVGSSGKIDMVTSKASCPEYVSLPLAHATLAGAPVFYLALLGALVVFTVAFLHVADIYL